MWNFFPHILFNALLCFQTLSVYVILYLTVFMCFRTFLCATDTFCICYSIFYCIDMFLRISLLVKFVEASLKSINFFLVFRISIMARHIQNLSIWIFLLSENMGSPFPRNLSSYLNKTLSRTFSILESKKVGL